MKLHKNKPDIIKPENLEERVIWYMLIGTYGFYLLGIQPIIIPLIAWVLAAYLIIKLWFQIPGTPREQKITIPLTVWVWIVFLAIMLLGLIIAHVDFRIESVRTIKSILKWMREWALWGLFLLISCLKIRPKLLYRGVCILCLQSLILMVICYGSYLVKIPDGPLYVSPIASVGGNSPDLYSVMLYLLDEEANQVRLTLFAPWAPNMALIAMIFFFMARQDANKVWRMIGTIGATAMVISSCSRMALIAFPAVMLLTWGLTNFAEPILHFTGGILSFMAGIFSPMLLNFVEVFVDRFNAARANSSNLRMILIRMSLRSWLNDAPIWGHGFTKEKGPAYTYFYPIGTSGCGTWVNLLYTKGIVGLIAVLVPFVLTFIDLLLKAQKSVTARVGLSTFLVFFFYSWIEELDLLAFIYWPGIVMLGIALKEKSPVSFMKAHWKAF